MSSRQAPVADLEGDVGAPRRGEADLVGVIDRLKNVGAGGRDGVVVGVETGGEHRLGDAGQRRAAGAPVGGRRPGAGMAEALRGRGEERVGCRERIGNRSGRFGAVLGARRVPDEDRLVGRREGGLVEGVADRAAPVVSDNDAGLAVPDRQTLLDGGLGGGRDRVRRVDLQPFGHGLGSDGAGICVRTGGVVDEYSDYPSTPNQFGRHPVQTRRPNRRSARNSSIDPG